MTDSVDTPGDDVDGVATDDDVDGVATDGGGDDVATDDDVDGVATDGGGDDVATDDDLAWETIDRTEAYRCEGFTVRRDRVRLPDGSETAFDAVQKPDSVVILPFATTDEVVLVEEWRHAVGRVSRGLPAGGIEDGESVADAARRELREETGHVADRVEPMGEFEPANGLLDAAHHYVVAHDCRRVDEPDLDPDESIRTARTTLAELRAAIRQGRIRDGRTALGVLFAAERGTLPPD